MEILNSEDYTKEERTVNLVWANVFGVVIFIPVILIYGLPYYFIWGNSISNHSIHLLSIGGLIILVAGIIFHELIHGIFLAMYTQNGFKSIKFGVFWKMLTPYCHCKEPLKVKHYIIGAIMPAIILGIIPGIVAICIGNLALLILGILFTVAAGGDFLIIKMLLKENKDDYVEDHPSEAGFYIYRKK